MEKTPLLLSRIELSQRIQKVLANTGAGSRRQIERWIEAGKVLVDGRVAKLGDQLTGHEKVRIDGKEVRISAQAIAGQKREHLIYYKPVGEITTRNDPEGRPTVFDKVPAPSQGRWISVGRLDLATSGLLLLTTDGELAHRLMHPSYEVERHYSVRILGHLEDAHFEQLRVGIMLEDGLAKVASIKPAGGAGVNTWYDVSLQEGRNREVRRIFEAVGFAVSRLIRTRFGPISLSRLRRGQTRELTKGEERALYQSVGLERKQMPPKRRSHR